MSASMSERDDERIEWGLGSFITQETARRGTMSALQHARALAARLQHLLVGALCAAAELGGVGARRLTECGGTHGEQTPCTPPRRPQLLRADAPRTVMGVSHVLPPSTSN